MKHHKTGTTQWEGAGRLRGVDVGDNIQLSRALAPVKAETQKPLSPNPVHLPDRLPPRPQEEFAIEGIVMQA